MFFVFQILLRAMLCSTTWTKNAKLPSTACASPTPSPLSSPTDERLRPTLMSSEPSFVFSSTGPSGVACTHTHSHVEPHPHFTSFSHRYGNKEGLLMGVALEVMLVLVCQLYPNHSEFDILYNFFNVFAKWPWADESKGIVIITGKCIFSCA